MRKFVSIVVIILSAFISKAQIIKLPSDSITGKVCYSGIVHVDSTKKDILYQRAKQWFALTYNSAKEVIQMDDKEAGSLIGRASFDIYSKALGITGNGGFVQYSISIYLKDNKIKYVITDFIHSGILGAGGAIENYYDPSHRTFSQKQINNYLEQVNQNAEAVVNSLTTYIKSVQDNPGSNNW